MWSRLIKPSLGSLQTNYCGNGEDHQEKGAQGNLFWKRPSPNILSISHCLGGYFNRDSVPRGGLFRVGWIMPADRLCDFSIGQVDSWFNQSFLLLNLFYLQNKSFWTPFGGSFGSFPYMRAFWNVSRSIVRFQIWFEKLPLGQKWLRYKDL